MLPYFN